MRIITLSVLALALVVSSFRSPDSPAPVINIEQTIHWYTLEEALEAQNKEPKKILMDIYTDWCGWCKVMDSKTFADEAVVAYMNEHFYAVKFDAEQKEDVTLDGKTYKHIARGRNGVNELALDLLDMQPSYPAFVLLDEDCQRMGYFRGYKEPAGFMAKVEELLSAGD